MPYNEANPNLSTCDNCDEVIPLTDLQGHGLGLCAKCRVKPSVIASYEHPRDAGDAVIAESHRQEMEEDKQNREIKIPHDIPTEGKVVTGVEDESKHQSMSSDQVLSKGGRRPH